MFYVGDMANSPIPMAQILFSCFLYEFLSRTSIRTFEAENLQKNKHIQPQPKFRYSYKKTCICAEKYEKVFAFLRIHC